jgi:hypothetical protein
MKDDLLEQSENNGGVGGDFPDGPCGGLLSLLPLFFSLFRGRQGQYAF